MLCDLVDRDWGTVACRALAQSSNMAPSKQLCHLSWTKCHQFIRAQSFISSSSNCSPRTQSDTDSRFRKLFCLRISLQIRTGTWTIWLKKSLLCNLHYKNSPFPNFKNFVLRVLDPVQTKIQQFVSSFHRSCLMNLENHWCELPCL